MLMFPPFERYDVPHILLSFLDCKMLICQQTLSPSAGKSASPGPSNSTGTVNGEMYIADGDYIRDIEVNDLRNRYTLTKGSTQKMVNTPLCHRPLIFQLPSEGFYKTFHSCRTLDLPCPHPKVLCGGLQAYSKHDSIHYTNLFGIC